jgi:hypothetical protein
MPQAMQLVDHWNAQRDETIFDTGIISDRPVALFRERLHKLNLLNEAGSPVIQVLVTSATVADRITAPFYYEIYQRLVCSTSGELTDAVALAPPSPPRRVSRAVEAAEALIRWLDITYDDLERLTGISRSAFFYWKRKGTDPRPSTVRRLLRVHSIVGLAVRQFGLDGAQSWLSSGTPTGWDLFASGDLAEVEQRAQSLFFRGSGLSSSGFGSVGDNTEQLVVKPPTEVASFRRAQRRPKRGRPSSS